MTKIAILKSRGKLPKTEKRWKVEFYNMTRKEVIN